MNYKHFKITKKKTKNYEILFLMNAQTTYGKRGRPYIVYASLLFISTFFVKTIIAHRSIFELCTIRLRFWVFSIDMFILITYNERNT